MWQTLDNPKKDTPSSQQAPNSGSLASQLRTTAEQATIGRSLVIKGEVSGSEPLYIDGRIEGTITLNDNRVTIGRNGSVTANITARELVVMGKLHGNANVTDRVDIRAEGSFTGDVVAQRLSIEDGAYFKGSVDLKKADKPHAEAKPAKPEAPRAPVAFAASAGKQ